MMRLCWVYWRHPAFQGVEGDRVAEPAFHYADRSVQFGIHWDQASRIHWVHWGRAEGQG